MGIRIVRSPSPSGVPDPMPASTRRQDLCPLSPALLDQGSKRLAVR